MDENDDVKYYYNRKEKYLKQLQRLYKSLGAVLLRYIDQSLADVIVTETKKEFEKVLLALPYIGGDKHVLNFSYIASAAGLACIRVLEKRGLAVDAIGKILYETYEQVFTSLPFYLKALLRWMEFSGHHRKKIKEYAEQSKLKKYPGDWVMNYVEGNGVDFDYGQDYTECAVLKLFRQMGVEHYMPYICVGDLAASRALKTGLHRTTTLYFGGAFCDFRFKKYGEALPGLPVENLPEFKNRRI